MNPLDGITVVALEHAVAAPFATRQLADLGARVIKIERPGIGDFSRAYDRTVKGQSSYFVWLNRGKESAELDIKSPADRALLDELVAKADVLIQNLAPGALDRLGLSGQELRRRHRRLITCAISGYGSGGSYSSKKAYDLMVQCETGLVSVTGTGPDPAKVGISVADIATGMYAFTGVLTALYERERTGSGSTIEVSMLDALGEWMSQPMYYELYGGRHLARTGARHSSIAPYGPYRTGDGELIFLGVQTDREWGVLCRQVLHRPELAEDPRFAHNPERLENNAEITPLVEAAFAGRTRDQVISLLEASGIANARLRSPLGFAQHPQLVHRDRWREVPTPAGDVRALLPPVTVVGREQVMKPVPALGEHTELIRREFGPVEAKPFASET